MDSAKIQDVADVQQNAHKKFETGTVSDKGDNEVSKIDGNGDEDEDDDGYNEDEDEDYEGDKIENGIEVDNGEKKSEDNEEEEDDEEYIVEEDRKELAKYSTIESSEGGLIKTRKQRQQEEEEAKKRKKYLSSKNNGDSSKSSLNIDSIWAELNKPSSSPSTTTATPNTTSSPSNSISPINETSKTTNEPEKIKIKSSYEFAGKTITEEKLVDVNSEEAKAYLNSSKLTPKLESSASENGKESTIKPKTPLLKRRRKRESLLDAVISNSSKTKLSTLEKSRLDWATYVDKNKISDELKYTNKDGYLEKQDFLNRVDSRRDNIYKDAKTKTSKN